MIQLSKILPLPQCFSSSLLSSLLRERESGKMRDAGNEVAQDVSCLLCTYQCQPGGGGKGGEGRGIGRGFDRPHWPGCRAFELSCCPGGRDI